MSCSLANFGCPRAGATTRRRFRLFAVVCAIFPPAMRTQY
jgi:hypothetical protein